MKPSIIISVMLAGLASIACERQPGSPQQEAVRAKVAENAGVPLENVQIHTFEQIDSVRLGEEIARRRATISLRLKISGDKYAEYSSRGLMNNAARKLSDIKADEVRLAALDSIENAHKTQADSVIARDYRFSGQIRPMGGGGWEQTGEMYASVSPSLRVLAVSNEQRDLHKSTGHAIPAYDSLFRD